MKAKVCGYCGTESAYLCCLTCFPGQEGCTFGICNPSTGRQCVSEHCSGVKPKHGSHPYKSANPQKRACADASDSAQKKKQAQAAGRQGGLATQKATKTRARH